MESITLLRPRRVLRASGRGALDWLFLNHGRTTGRSRRSLSFNLRPTQPPSPPPPRIRRPTTPQAWSDVPPRRRVFSLTTAEQCLDILNDPTQTFPLRLAWHALHKLFSRVKQRLIPHSEDYDTLSALCAPLAEAVYNSKLELIQNQKARRSEERPAIASTMQSSSTLVLDKFLEETNNILLDRHGEKLQSYLVIEPPFNDLYNTMIAQIRQAFPKGSEDALEEKCNRKLTAAQEDSDGSSWAAFVKFIANYFVFIRDVDAGNLLDTYNLLSELQQKCNSALTHPTNGVIILPTVISYARMFARLAIGLDKRPELIAHLVRKASFEDDGARETLPERAANILRQAFVTCLNDRTPTASGTRGGKPDGKKSGIYKIANLCLKILFQCNKSRNGEQIFTNIYNQSPPLSIYPASERVTYLYYLGRFMFASNHFYAAQLALQAAYDQCLASPQCLRQRRLILIYLIASNIILGRFPSEFLYRRPEAQGIRERFNPICRAMARGDLESFRRLTDSKHEHADWFLHFRIFLQIENRCEVIVWRSLFRRTFLLAGVQGDANSRRAPTLDLHDVLALFTYLEKRAMMPLSQLDGGPGRRHTNWIFMSQDPPPSAAYIDADFEGCEDFEPEILLPTILGMESICSSLINQGLLNGFISHKLRRFAIQGAKRKGALAAGFPNVWEVIKLRSDDEVPGWKKDVSQGGAVAGGFGPGMVVNLSGARPVGAAAFD